MLNAMKKIGVEEEVIEALERLHSLEADDDIDEVSVMVREAHDIWCKHLPMLDNLYLVSDLSKLKTVIRAWEDKDAPRVTIMSLNEVFSPTRENDGYEDMMIFQSVYMDAMSEKSSEIMAKLLKSLS